MRSSHCTERKRDLTCTTQFYLLSTDAATFFNDSDAFCRSDSEWAAETNNLIPTGKRHLSSVDLLEVTTNTESSFNTWQMYNNQEIESAKIVLLLVRIETGYYLLTRSAMCSRRFKSLFIEPVDFSNSRKTTGDSGLLAIKRPGISDNPAFTKYIF